MSKKIFFLLASLVGSVFVAPHTHAALTSTLPDGVSWQPGGYEIPLSIWNVRTYPPSACGLIEQPTGCQNDVYAGKMSQSQCRHAAAPDTCASPNKYPYIPAASKSQAKCTVVRIHTSTQNMQDTRLCAACTGSTCDFFSGNGAFQAKSTPAPSEQPPVTDTPPVIDGSGTNGSGDGTGEGQGSGDGTCTGDSCGGDTVNLVNLLTVGSLQELLSLLLGLVVQIGSILLVLALVWAGFQFVAAQGNEEKIRSARDALTWTVIGGLLLLGAEALSLVIKATIESL